MKKEYDYNGYTYMILVKSSETQIKGIYTEHRYDIFTYCDFTDEEGTEQGYRADIRNVKHSRVEDGVKEAREKVTRYLNEINEPKPMHQGLANMGFKEA